MTYSSTMTSCVAPIILYSFIILHLFYCLNIILYIPYIWSLHRLSSFPGFLKASIQNKNQELKDKILVTFHTRQDFEILLNISFTKWQGSNFVEFTPRRISFPESDRQIYI